MSVNQNHWGTVLNHTRWHLLLRCLLRGQRRFPLHLDLDNETKREKIGVCYTSHGTLAVRGNDKARKRGNMKGTD